MLQALLVILGLSAWAVVARGGAGSQDAVPVGISVVLAVLIAARLGWLGRDAAVAPRALRALAGTPARWRAKAVGALQVARGAVSADVKLKPALVKLAARDRDGEVRAAAALSEAPGAFAVALSPGAVMVHVLNEDVQKEEGLALRAGLPRSRRLEQEEAP